MDFWSIKKLFLLCILVFSVFQLFSQTDHLIVDVIAAYEEVETYEADFIQTNYWKELDKSFSSQGKIYFEGENLLLQYDNPENQILLIDKDKIMIYEPVRNQALLSDRFNYDLNPKKILQKYKDNAEIKVIQHEDEADELTVIMENGEAYIFSISDNMIISIVYNGNNGDSVKYSFSKSTINQEFEPGLFAIELSEDVVIIDNRTDSIEME